jgi:septal ring factor EnvC (AmiA/AmiB activator)
MSSGEPASPDELVEQMNNACAAERLALTTLADAEARLDVAIQAFLRAKAEMQAAAAAKSAAFSGKPTGMAYPVFS